MKVLIEMGFEDGNTADFKINNESTLSEHLSSILTALHAAGFTYITNLTAKCGEDEHSAKDF